MNPTILTKTLQPTIPYTGKELRPHWISEQTGEFGSALVAFAGPAEVATDELVDLVDKRANAIIRAKNMLHFVGEFFTGDLCWLIAQQRIFTAIVCDEVRLASSESSTQVKREGDDVYVRRAEADPWRKFSVSIVTSSPVSCLLHFGINIDATGAPVNAIGLEDLGIADWKSFANSVLSKFSAELTGQWLARTKVLPR